jgi:diguanylate cyclase (GGDEF)-like protein
VIIAVAAAIDRAVRDVDVAARLGGDEFVVLLTDTAADEVPAIIDRMRRELADDAAAPPVAAFSTGVVERPPGTDSTLADLVSAADREMYQQKVLRRLRRD